MIRDRIAAVLAGEEGFIAHLQRVKNGPLLNDETSVAIDVNDMSLIIERLQPSPATLDALVALVEEAVARERERAAGIAENAHQIYGGQNVRSLTPFEIATAIRKGPDDE